jgi:hypothetical protein
MTITTGIFGFFILSCAYAAQYWAYRCYKEMKRINDRLEQSPRL